MNAEVRVNADINDSGHVGEERGSPDEYIDAYKGDGKTRKRERLYMKSIIVTNQHAHMRAEVGSIMLQS